MALRIWEFPVAQEFPESREIPVTWEFPRLKLFPPISQEMGITREFPACGFPLNISALGEADIQVHLKQSHWATSFVQTATNSIVFYIVMVIQDGLKSRTLRGSLSKK